MYFPRHIFVTYPFVNIDQFNSCDSYAVSVSPIVKTRRFERITICTFDNGDESRP